eukprot:scaffold494_cov117-Isochrysis_galbana.AAC.3
MDDGGACRWAGVAGAGAVEFSTQRSAEGRWTCGILGRTHSSAKQRQGGKRSKHTTYYPAPGPGPSRHIGRYNHFKVMRWEAPRHLPERERALRAGFSGARSPKNKPDIYIWGY